MLEKSCALYLSCKVLASKLLSTRFYHKSEMNGAAVPIEGIQRLFTLCLVIPRMTIFSYQP